MARGGERVVVKLESYTALHMERIDRGAELCSRRKGEMRIVALKWR